MKIKGNAIYEKVYKAMSKPKPVEKPTPPKDKDVDMEKKEEPQKEEPQKEEPQKEEPQKEEDVKRRMKMSRWNKPFCVILLFLFVPCC